MNSDNNKRKTTVEIRQEVIANNEYTQTTKETKKAFENYIIKKYTNQTKFYFDELQ